MALLFGDVSLIGRECCNEMERNPYWLEERYTEKWRGDVLIPFCDVSLIGENGVLKWRLETF